MFEFLMLIVFLSIGLSQLLPEDKERKPDRKKLISMMKKGSVGEQLTEVRIAQPRVHHLKTDQIDTTYLHCYRNHQKGPR